MGFTVGLLLDTEIMESESRLPGIKSQFCHAVSVNKQVKTSFDFFKLRKLKSSLGLSFLIVHWHNEISSCREHY